MSNTDFRECHCDCHADENVMHVMACCRTCPHCGRHILNAFFRAHMATHPTQRADCENGDCADHYGDSAAWCSKCRLAALVTKNYPPPPVHAEGAPAPPHEWDFEPIDARGMAEKVIDAIPGILGMTPDPWPADADEAVSQHGRRRGWDSSREEVVCAVAELLTSAGLKAPSLWREIATAPHDGTNVLLWWPFWCKDRPTIGFFGFKGIQQWFAPEVLEGDGAGPTHWMPLPLPPAPPKEKA